MGFVKELVLYLPDELRKCSANDWVYVNFNFPHCVLGYLYKLSVIHLSRPHYPVIFFIYHSALLVVPGILFSKLRPKL